MKTSFRRKAVHAVAGALALGLALAGCSKNNPVAPKPVPPLSAVTLAPGDTTLTVGQALQYHATAIDSASGQPVSGMTFNWSSSNPGVFTVSGTGVVSAVGEGTALLVVSLGGKADSADIRVQPATSGWFAQTSNTASKLNGVFFQPDGRHGWAVGATGAIRATSDAGVTWTIQTGASSNLNAVWFTSASEGWIVGDNGALLHTTNSGANWTLTTIANGAHLYGLWFATPDTGWAVGANGAVVATVDHGATWTESSPTAYSLRGVAFYGTRFGWAVGDNGVMLGTVDRGLTWNVLTTVTAANLKGVWRTSLTRANAVGATGATPRTTDDGSGNPVWSLASAGAGFACEGVCFANDSTGWAVGLNGTGFVLRSDDGGATWATQSAVSQYRLNHVYFIDAQHGWAVGDNGTILHTATGGKP